MVKKDEKVVMKVKVKETEERDERNENTRYLFIKRKQIKTGRLLAERESNVLYHNTNAIWGRKQNNHMYWFVSQYVILSLLPEQIREP